MQYLTVTLLARPAFHIADFSFTVPRFKLFVKVNLASKLGPCEVYTDGRSLHLLKRNVSTTHMQADCRLNYVLYVSTLNFTVP